MKENKLPHPLWQANVLCFTAPCPAAQSYSTTLGFTTRYTSVWRMRQTFWSLLQKKHTIAEKLNRIWFIKSVISTSLSCCLKWGQGKWHVLLRGCILLLWTRGEWCKRKSPNPEIPKGCEFDFCSNWVESPFSDWLQLPTRINAPFTRWVDGGFQFNHKPSYQYLKIEGKPK